MAQQTSRVLLLPLFDQGLASLASLLCVFTVSRFAPSETFGVFAFGYSLVTVLMAVTRSHFGLGVSLAPKHMRSVTLSRGLALLGVWGPLGGAGVGALCWSMGWQATGESHTIVAVALALGTPSLLMQDLVRYFLIAEKRVRAAAVSDGLRVGLLLVAFMAGPQIGMIGILGMWVASPLISLAWGWKKAAVAPTFAATSAAAMTEGRTVRIAVSASAVLSAGTTAVTGAIIAAGLGPQVLAVLRGAATLFGPLNVVISYLDLALLPRYVESQGRARHRVFALGAILVLLAAISWTTILLLTPADFGRHVLGETWEGAAQLLPWLGLEYVGLASLAGILIVLKGARAGALILVNKMLTSLLLLVLVVWCVNSGLSSVTIQAGYAAVAAVGVILAMAAVWRVKRRGDI